MPQLSQKGKDLPSSPIRKLIKYADQAKANGVSILHLNIGQPDIAAPKEALDAVYQSNLDLLPYGTSQGTLRYRKKLCAYYAQHQIVVDPENILVTTGASEALTFCLNAICDVGDEIIIPEPFYANYNGFAKAANVEVVPIISDFDNGFALPSPREFQTKITPKTKAVLICNPNNPTGYVYSKKEIEALGNLAIENDLFLIVDEVYREFIYTESRHYSVLANSLWKEHAIMIDSVSKRYSLCGARVGCIVSRNEELIQTILKFAHLRLSPPTLALIASEAALDAPKSYLEKVVAEYSKRRYVLKNALEKIPGVKVSDPMGALFCIVQLPVENAEVFSKFLLTDFSDERETVMLAPASGFYASTGYGKNEVRIAFILESSKLLRAVAILEKALVAYSKS